MLLSAVQVGALFAAALIYFALSARLGLEWSDGGQTIYGAWRVARGELPYRDFQHLYGPSLFFFNGALLRIFGEDLLVVRLGLVAQKAGVAVLVYLLARQVARAPFALMAYAIFLAVWGSPWWLFNTPYANHYAVGWTLGGVLAVLLLSSRPLAAAFLGGICCGIGATFKQTSGTFAVFALLLFLLFERSSETGSVRWLQRAARTARWLVVAATVVLAVGIVVHTPVTWGSVLIAAPLVGTTIAVAFRERRSAPGRQQFAAALACVVGMALPLAAYALLYLASGGLSALVRDMLLVLPAHFSWFCPLEPPGPRAVLNAAAVAAAVVALCTAPPWRYWSAAVAAGLAGFVLWPVISTGAVTAWLKRVLPGFSFWGLYWLPFVTLLVSAPLFAESRSSSVPVRYDRAVSLLFWHGCAVLLAFLPCADVPHAPMLLPPFLPLLVLAADRLQQMAAGRSAVGGVIAVLLVVVLATGIAYHQVQRLIDLRARRPADAGLPRATGIWDPSRTYVEGGQLVAYLATQVEPNEPVLVLPSDQTVYFLADRPSALQEVEMVFYLVRFNLSTKAEVQSLVNEAAVAEAVATRRPLVIERIGRPLDRFRSFLPTLAAFLDQHYRTRDAFGPYVVREWAG